MVRSCAPREVVSDALRAKFDEMARKEKDEKKKGGAKIAPERDDVAEGELAGRKAAGKGGCDHTSTRHDVSGRFAGGDAGEGKTAELSAGSKESGDGRAEPAAGVGEEKVAEPGPTSPLVASRT